MLRITFRTKLLLAMTSVVVGVTVVSLLVTQQRVQANYARIFRAQYERQVAYFTTLQEARLGLVKEQCLTLTQSPRLLELMRKGAVDATRLYELDELRPILRELPDESRPGGRIGRSPSASFYRFIAADGSVISQPETGKRLETGGRQETGGRRQIPPNLRRRLDQQLAFIREMMRDAEIQNVGYLPVVLRTNLFFGRTNSSSLLRTNQAGQKKGPPRERPERPPPSPNEPHELQEIIVTRVVDPQDGKNLGAFILGIPLPDLVPQPKHAPGLVITNIIQAGILIEERLFADPSVIPEAVNEIATEEILERIKVGQKLADFSAEIGGVPYQIFYEILNPDSKFPARFQAYQVCLYSMAGARAEQNALRWKLLALGAAALAVALVVSLLLSHGLSAPIRQLVAGTTEIERGNFQIRIPVQSGDEVGQLTRSFNGMAEGLAQRERYRTVLNMFADEEVAQRVVAGELSLGGELREITVLFCDIRGFTALTQNMPPRDVIEMLNEHMTGLSRVLKEHNGLLDKYVGDLLMAIFGAPIRHGDDALNAVRCALRLRDARTLLNRTSRHALQVGIGLASGTVVAGCMGSNDRLNYTVLGERVNLASRLCDRAGAGEILIDENTRKLLGEKIATESAGNFELKGFATPVAAYRLIAVNVTQPVSA